MTGWKEDAEGWKEASQTQWYKDNQRKYNELYKNEDLFMGAVTQTSLDDAIKHAEEVADSRCDMCGQEHKQLASWLKELKAYKEQRSCEDMISRSVEWQNGYLQGVENTVKEFKAEIERFKCDDAISREAVSKWYCNMTCDKDYCTEPCLEHKQIMMLPPVQPSREIKPKEEMTVEETISDLIWLLGSNLLDKGSEDTVLNAIYYLENQLSRKGHWIDVSERLPERNKRVIVCYETMEGLKVDTSMFDKYGCLIGKAVAWMPLPEPYKADMRGNIDG